MVAPEGPTDRAISKPGTKNSVLKEIEQIRHAFCGRTESRDSVEMVGRATLDSNKFMNVANQTSRKPTPPEKYETIEIIEKAEKSL